MKNKDIQKKRTGRSLEPLKITFIDPEIKTEEDIKDYKEKVSGIFDILFEEVMKAQKVKKPVSHCNFVAYIQRIVPLCRTHMKARICWI